jgi:hypothetical protein
VSSGSLKAPTRLTMPRCNIPTGFEVVTRLKCALQIHIAMWFSLQPPSYSLLLILYVACWSSKAVLMLLLTHSVATNQGRAASASYNCASTQPVSSQVKHTYSPAPACSTFSEKISAWVSFIYLLVFNDMLFRVINAYSTLS